MSLHRYMLDTDILIYLLRGLKIAKPQDNRRSCAERIRDQVESHSSAGSQVCVSMITVCELEYGVARAPDSARQRRALYKALAPFEFLAVDELAIPQQYGYVRYALDQCGQPIGAMDLLIAAHALAVNATLVTNNTREFGRVEGLEVENWTK